MTRTQHWLMALLLTTTLLSLGVMITLINRPKAPIEQSTNNTPATQALSVLAVSNVTPVSDDTTAQVISEQRARQQASQLLPAQTIESIQQVNFEGKLAYQVTTAQTLLYLNADTGEVLTISPRPAPQPKLVQVNYEPAAADGSQERAREYDDHEEHEEDEHDDD